MGPTRIGRGHMIAATALVTIGFILMSNAAFAVPSWLSSSELQWCLGLGALFGGIIWAAGRVGWWIVRHIIQWWLHQTFSCTAKRR
jgi:hypothetical protein